MTIVVFSLKTLVLVIHRRVLLPHFLPTLLHRSSLDVFAFLIFHARVNLMCRNKVLLALPALFSDNAEIDENRPLLFLADFGLLWLRLR